MRSIRGTSVGALAILMASLAGVLSAATPLQGQDPTPDDPASSPAPVVQASAVQAFVTVGVGMASPDIGGVVSLSVHGGKVAGALRMSGASELTFLSAAESAMDIAVMLGAWSGGPGGWARFLMGPALVGAEQKSVARNCQSFFCSYTESSTTIGLAAQADVVWTPARGLGLGLSAFGNMNSAVPYAGLALSLHLGSVRKR